MCYIISCPEFKGAFISISSSGDSRLLFSCSQSLPSTCSLTTAYSPSLGTWANARSALHKKISHLSVSVQRHYAIW